jgi:hypothetical protein
MVYRGIPVEQVRQRFEVMKQEPTELLSVPVVKVKRKLRIPATDSK